MLSGIIVPINYCSYRKPVLPIEMEHLNSSADSTSTIESDDMKEKNIDKYCQDVCTLKKQLFLKADQNIKKAQKKYKRDYDKKHCRKKVCISILHYVLMIAIVLLWNSYRNLNQEHWYCSETVPKMEEKVINLLNVGSAHIESLSISRMVYTA